MTDQQAEKTRLRKVALAARDAMPETDRIEASLALGERVMAVVEGLDPPPAVVSGFLPIRSEADIRPLMMSIADRGARLCVPAIVSGELQFRHLVRGAPLEPQGFGTSAPGPGAEVLHPDLLFVPLAAFDRAGGRIGYGRGYYDRAIAALRSLGHAPRLIGVGFAAQEMAHAPMDAHDVRLPLIVTERETIRPA